MNQVRLTLQQVARYGIVGLSANALGYLLYLALTTMHVEPVVAMTLLYVVGVLQTFIFNRRWTFEHGGRVGVAFKRYVFLYLLGYGINLAVMRLLVGAMGWPHQWVMLGLVLGMPLFFFVGQKFWVFAGPAQGRGAE